MSDSVTIARPYAKAVFQNALVKGDFAGWSHYLHRLSLLMLNESVFDFITNPTTTASQHSELLLSAIADIASADQDCVNNFVQTLSDNRRLAVLPDILALFESMRSEYEKVLAVKVCSYAELSAVQQQQLILSLSKRLQRQVTLEIVIDKDLIGGAVIHAGDLVIDGSVRGKLDKLRTALAA